MSLDACTACDRPVWADEPHHHHVDSNTYAHLVCPSESNLDKALAVVREDWQPGLEVYGRCPQRNETRTWAVVAVDWTRGAGPILCEDMDGSGAMQFFQPWDLQKVPTTVDEIEEFLRG